ncbi:MAG TPA: hypothetical protein VM121_08870 [Acidimicrobiales bacterium]|nr:hypothetical protein [Acidimicrobiales bacterium]
MTLVLTVVSQRYVVQASDRRLTGLDGSLFEDTANKALIYCSFASFALTGLATIGNRRTEHLMLSALSQGHDLQEAMAVLGKRATAAFRQLQFPPTVPTHQRDVIRRTAFVAGGFQGLRHPERLGLERTVDDLYPFAAVVSNAHELSGAWRDRATRDFRQEMRWLPPSENFILVVSGQPIPSYREGRLRRHIRICIERCEGSAPLARILAREIVATAATNPAVGPNVMCTTIPRVHHNEATVPICSTIQVPVTTELERFATSDDALQYPSWIFHPTSLDAQLHYGPNVAAPGFMLAGTLLGPTHLVASEEERRMKAGEFPPKLGP